MSGRLAARLALAYLAVSGLLVGVWAAFAPRSFFSDFPGLGHMWTAVDGPYNEHLVRDVGELNLALAVVTIAALIWFSRTLAITAAVAWIVYSAPHLAYHAFNLSVVSPDDRVAEIAALTIPILLAGVVIVSVRKEPRAVR